MAASAPPPQQQQQQKPIEEMMRNLKVDPSAGELADSNTVNPKESSPSDAISCIPSDAISCISSAGDATGSVKEGDVDHEALATDQGAALPAAAAAAATPGYYGYYYNPGFDGTYGGMENNQGYYVAAGVDGMELQYPVMQGDNGSLVYFMPGPGVQPGYGPYNPPCLPVAMVGVDGQYFGQQPYSPGPVYQPTIPAYFPYGEAVPSPYFWDPSIFVGDGTYGNTYSGVLEIPGSRPDMSAPSYQHTTPSKNFAPSEINKSLETKSSFPMLDVSSGHCVQNQLKPLGKALQHASSFQSDALGKGYFPIAKFPPYDQGKGGIVYPNGPAKANLRSWGNSEKSKPRSKISNASDFGLFDEQNNGPRTIHAKTLRGNGDGSLPTDGNGNSNSVTSLIRRDHYNLPDFPMEYDRAFFFVIKSYSEDDVHKSIKYNVWSSTSNGNKKLDNAYQDAQKMSGKGSKCPLFLFFSVNASGQFCGVAEMIGGVDFNKNMDFWQQDKWNGFFPVKWHIIKDVPNPQLRHIILENNENKPVTNSRDAQEVKFTQGIEVLNIFKKYVAKTSILDDFEFYESRQKVIQERKRPWISHYDHKQQKGGELTTSSVDSEKNSRENQLENKAK